jgi:hypothetical protein
MSEKWYVVSESEPQELYTQALNAHMRPNLQPLKDADAACRARLVPEWAAGMVLIGGGALLQSVTRGDNQ